MEPTLQLNVEDRSAVQEVVLQNLKSEDWRQLEAAIFVANGTYVYKRKVSDHPLAFEYKCLSPETLQRAFHIERLDTGWLPSGVIRCGASTAGEWTVLFVPPAQHAIASLLRPEAQQYGLHLRTGMVQWGPFGTGKSLSAKLAANWGEAKRSPLRFHCTV